MIHLKEIQMNLAMWQKQNFPERLLSNKDQHLIQLALGMNEEAGEVAHSVLKRSQGIREDQSTDDLIEDGIIENFIYGMQMLTAINRDVESALIKVVNEILKRNWIKFPVNGVDR